MKTLDTIFDVEELKRMLEAAEADDEGNRRVFLGTVFALTPSGKYYMPFANSNVCECPFCEGKGNLPNPHYRKKKLAAARRKDWNLRGNTIRQYGPWFARGWPESIRHKLEKTQKRVQRFDTHITCPHCGGLGSQEAYQDERWHEQAEKELRTINAFLENGEGDPCDLFAVLPAE